MRGFSYLLVLAGVVAARGNLTLSTSPVPSSPSTTDATTEEPVFSIAGGGGYNTCRDKTQRIYVTVTETKPGSETTITTTCTETVHNTETHTSTTTCTVVRLSSSSFFFSFPLFQKRRCSVAPPMLHQIRVARWTWAKLAGGTQC